MYEVLTISVPRYQVLNNNLGTDIKAQDRDRVGWSLERHILWHNFTFETELYVLCLQHNENFLFISGKGLGVLSTNLNVLI